MCFQKWKLWSGLNTYRAKKRRRFFYFVGHILRKLVLQRPAVDVLYRKCIWKPSQNNRYEMRAIFLSYLFLFEKKVVLCQETYYIQMPNCSEIFIVLLLQRMSTVGQMSLLISCYWEKVNKFVFFKDLFIIQFLFASITYVI